MKNRTFFIGSIVISGVLLCGCTSIQNGKSERNKGQGDVDVKTKVVDIVKDPIFDDFGRFIFPISYQKPSDTMTISDIDSLLPYHSHIQADTTIDVVNYMKHQVQNQQIIFYDIYTDEEKEKDSKKNDTGLFFFKGNPNAPFAIVNAGGGFAYVGSIHESYPHALALSKKGYNAFALQYRTGNAEYACEDLAAAIAFIYEHKEELEVKLDSYSLWGGSAGARMAAYLGSYGTESFGQKKYPRPSAVIMQYTGYSNYTEDDPPTYAIVGEDDNIASWQVMGRRIDNLKKIGVDTEFHVYPDLEHGFGLGIGTSAEGWINDAVSFWEQHMDKKE